LLSDVPGQLEDNAVMEKHGAEILYSTVKHVMHDVRTEDKVSQQDVLYEIIQIAKHWTKRK
jgi:hypothetical protein